MRQHKQKKILVAPLNWGLGHASRCVVIVNFLIENNFKPVIASDGDALVFFRKEFPNVESIELPSYGIKYSRKGAWLKWKLLFSCFSIYRAVQKEKKFILNILDSNEFAGVISDNRFGVYSDKIPSVYVTHQINVLAGITTKLSSWVHQRIISKFDECWVPDIKGENNLSGKLSQVTGELNFPIKYIGSLSRLNLKNESKKFDLLVLLSGPEPQRSLLEDKLLNELKEFVGKVSFVRGVFEYDKEIQTTEKITVFDYLLSNELEDLINQSELVLARSGYSTIMDLSKLNKRAFFIPTPGQTEQEYLAKSLEEKNIAPYAEQDNFQINQLEKVKKYNGFESGSSNENLNKNLLEIFDK